MGGSASHEDTAKKNLPYVLLPPVWSRDRITLRNRALASPIDLAGRKKRALFDEFFTSDERGLVSLNVAPAEENVEFYGNLAVEHNLPSHDGIHSSPLSADLSFRLQPDPEERSTFCEFSFGNSSRNTSDFSKPVTSTPVDDGVESTAPFSDDPSQSSSNSELRACYSVAHDFFPGEWASSTFGVLPIALSHQGYQMRPETTKFGLRVGSRRADFGCYAKPFRLAVGGWTWVDASPFSVGVQAETSSKRLLSTDFIAQYTQVASDNTPQYEVALKLSHDASPSLAMTDSQSNQDITASFYRHFILQRKAMVNTTFDKRVSAIQSYFDVGFEISQRVSSASAPSITLAGAYQLNKGAMVKAKLSGSKVSCAGVFKLWSTPSIAVSASLEKDLSSPGPSRYGVTMHLDHFSSETYEVANTREPVRSMRVTPRTEKQGKVNVRRV